MKVLVIGGAGKVGSFVMPYLRNVHDVCVFDLAQGDGRPDYIQGNVRDFAALKSACEGRDALIYMAMGSGRWGSPEGDLAHFDANVTGVHLALRAAIESDIRRVVHVSSMSVYDQLGRRYIHGETVVPDAREFYGLSKRLGEEVCRAACESRPLSVCALRLCLPVTKDEWRQLHAEGKQDIHTEAEDVARAMLLGLEKDFGGFQAFTISGDYAEKTMSMKKAKAVLGWEPAMRPEVVLSADTPATFTLGQFWNARPEPELKSTKVSATFSDGKLHVVAELEDDDVFNTATEHNQRTWETGDVFEIFARRDDSEEYVEVHVTPENIKLHLTFEDFTHTTRIEDDISRVAANPEEIVSTAERTETGWRATAVVPLPAGSGDLIRVSFCRYDATQGSEKLVLSSSSPHPVLRFHRPLEWTLCRIA
ncbi:MAG: NAD-dependent epimerase/dehydratase family protein [Armatimonas sp.]